MWLHIAGELVLAAACAAAALAALRHRAALAALGFGLIGITALIGAFVYGGVPGAEAPHEAVGFLAARIGLLLVAAKGWPGMKRGLLLVGACAVALLVPGVVSLGISVLALVAIAWPGRSARWPLALAGALLFALAGLVIGTRGEWLGVARVDLYHLGIALAVLAWTFAGVGRPLPPRLPAPDAGRRLA